MKVVHGFDDGVSGWIQRLAQTSLSSDDRWNFTSDTLSWLQSCFLVTTQRPRFSVVVGVNTYEFMWAYLL